MKDIARIECALIDIKYECGDRECKYCPMRTRYGECVIEVLDDGGPFADQAYSECVGKTGKRLLDNVDKGNADGKYTKKILAFMRTAAFPSMWNMNQWRAMFNEEDKGQNKDQNEKEKPQTVPDMIHLPNHYTWRDCGETLELIETFVKNQTDPYLAFGEGNVLKYLVRYPKKNGVEDLKKAREYLNRMIEHMEGKNDSWT